MYLDLEMNPVSGVIGDAAEVGGLDCATAVRMKIENSNESQAAQRMRFSQIKTPIVALHTSQPKAIVVNRRLHSESGCW